MDLHWFIIWKNKQITIYLTSKSEPYLNPRLWCTALSVSQAVSLTFSCCKDTLRISINTPALHPHWFCHCVRHWFCHNSLQHWCYLILQTKSGCLVAHTAVVALTLLVVKVCEESRQHIRNFGSVAFVLSYGFNASPHDTWVIGLEVALNMMLVLRHGFFDAWFIFTDSWIISGRVHGWLSFQHSPWCYGPVLMSCFVMWMVGFLKCIFFNFQCHLKLYPHWL